MSELLEENYTKHLVSPNIISEEKSGLIFCRNMLLRSILGQVNNSLGGVIFY